MPHCAATFVRVSRIGGVRRGAGDGCAGSGAADDAQDDAQDDARDDARDDAAGRLRLPPVLDRRRVRFRAARAGVAVTALAIAVAAGGCDAGPPPPTPPIVPGSSAAPREVNIVMKDWVFLPDPIDVVPGETVLLHVINGGLEIHEAVIGDQAVQDAWEAAEGQAANPPPGPTPIVSVPPGTAGMRIVAASGQRIDVVWTVPADPAAAGALLLGCHIPGHWAKGMRASLRIASSRG
jgi:uncharacterized cupredoxin-like copper-binding protein